MSTYPIKHLELVSGIKAHTIRMWEKRYGLFLPQRTDTNIRRYKDSDVKLILNITLLLRSGFKISKLAAKSFEEISELVLQNTKNNTSLSENEIEPLLLSLFAFDQSTFKLLLIKKIAEQGLERTYEDLILPLLYRIGILWQTGMIITTHEHFASNIVKQIIISHYEALNEPENDSLLLLFFLPEGEYHEIDILFYAYLAKKMGCKTLYLGQSTPLEDIIQSSKEIKPNVIFTSTSSSISKIKFDDFSKAICKNIPDCQLFVTGYFVNQNKSNSPEIVAIPSIATFKERVKGLTKNRCVEF